jgi:coenzyme F420-reducing hydrogenase delta subunit
MTFLKQLMSFSGIEEERLRFKWISSAEGPEFASEMNDFVKTIKELGPSPLNTSIKEGQKEQQAA